MSYLFYETAVFIRTAKIILNYELLYRLIVLDTVKCVYFIMTFKDMEKLIKKDGWKLQAVEGFHYHYVHSFKKGKVTIPFHGNKDFPQFVVKSILKQAGLKE